MDFPQNIANIKSVTFGTGFVSSQSRYSATLPANPFAFPQSRVIAAVMMKIGDDRVAVKEEIHEGNLLQVNSKANEDSIFNYVYRRLDVISESMKEIIVTGDETDARFVNLVSIMKYDLLFREFMVDVYHERVRDRSPLMDYDIMSFFERKGREDENVASWRYVTVFKLRRLYARILFEAGFIKSSSGTREICTPYISRDTKELLMKEGYEEYIIATLGSS
ncbi:MAG: DUF1819 family protein [Prevotella sp.]